MGQHLLKNIGHLGRVLSMASITPKKKSGRIVSYKFKTCVGRDVQGKQMFRSKTWTLPDGMSVFIHVQDATWRERHPPSSVVWPAIALSAPKTPLFPIKPSYHTDRS